MADKKFKLDVDIATKEAQANLKAAAKEAKKLGQEVDDTRSAGKKLADAMDMVTDDLAADLKRSEKAADSLGKALGPEMVADIRAQGRSLGDLVQDLKRVGLTYEDIEQDAEALAAAMKRANDVGKDISTHVTKPIQDLGRESDNSRNVLANMVGNSTQDLGALGGVAGTAGVAIGQLAEYAADGNISLAGLAGVAGPMLALGFATKFVADAISENQKRLEEQRKRIESYKQAMGEARDESVSLPKKLAQTWADNGGKIEVEISNATATMLEFGEATDDMGKIHDLRYPTAKRHVEDFADELAGLGVTGEQFAALAMQPIEKVREWGEAMVAAGADAEVVNKVMQGSIGLHGDLGKAAESDAIFQKVFGDATKEAGDEARTTADAVRTLNDRFGTLLDTLSDEDAYDSALDGFDNINQAAQDAYEAAATGAEDAASKGRDYERSIRDQKRLIIDYADSLGAVPKEVVSEVIAMLDQGEFDKAKAAVDSWANTPAYKKVIVATKQGDVGYERNAVGTSHFKGGMTLLGETGPELVELPKGSKVTSSVQTENKLNRAGSGTYVDNRTFNIQIPNQTPEQTAAELAKYQRRNGLS